LFIEVPFNDLSILIKGTVASACFSSHQVNAVGGHHNLPTAFRCAPSFRGCGNGPGQSLVANKPPAGNPGKNRYNKDRSADDTPGETVKKHDRSWLTLVSFLIATTLASSLVFALAFAAVTAAIGGESAQAADEPQLDPITTEQTFSGVITDARCDARHTNRQKNASECSRVCVRHGSNYVIIDGDKKYELIGELRQIAEFAGQRVSLAGVLDGQTIKVSSASLQAQDKRGGQ
jgi:hypothetical protein